MKKFTDLIKKSFSMKEIWYSSKGFANLPKHQLTPDFTICFENIEYKINSFLADFIFPKISQIHQSDPLFSKIEIPIKDTDFYFQNIISSLQGQSLQINEISIYFYLYIFNFFENEEIVSILENLKPTKLTKENIVSIIEEKTQTVSSIENEISFLAPIFFEVPYKKLSNLNPEVLSRIFQSKTFYANSEDEVLDFVNKIVDDKGDDYQILYDYVLYENLSNDKIYYFLNNFDFYDISGQIWNSLCQRMTRSSSSNTNKENNRYRNQIFNLPNRKEKQQTKSELKETKFRYYEGFTFNGILSSLTRETNRNIQDAGLITASSSSIYGDRLQFHPKMSLNLSDSSYFMSKDEPNSWIMLDFKNMEIQASHYVIRTYGDNSNSHLKSWILEASKDGHEWTVIDRRVTDYSLKEDWGTSTFKCSVKKRARFIRLTQTGLNHRDTNCLLLCSIDFYGKLYK